MLLYTGQRRSDVVRMGRQHVKDGAIEVRQVKTKARLLIPLHAELAMLVRGETDRLTFLVTQAGVPFTANGFYNHFTAWAQEAGLPAGLSPHGLRKAAARRLAEAGCTAHQIASVTGHKTLSEVQRYTVAAEQADLAKAAMTRLQRAKSKNGVVKPPRQTARK
jgi:integrase